MVRFIKALLVMGALSVFGAQNWDNVPVNLLLGGTRVHLFLLLLIAGGAGYVFALVRGIQHDSRLRQENRNLRSLARSADVPARDQDAVEIVDAPKRRRR